MSLSYVLLPIPKNSYVRIEWYVNARQTLNAGRVQRYSPLPSTCLHCPTYTLLPVPIHPRRG